MQEPAGFAEFARREYPRLVGALSLHCRHRQVAEELAQEALVRAADRWPRVSAMAAPGAWRHRVAMNLATSWLRRRQAERRAHARATPEGQADAGPDHTDTIVVREAVLRLPSRQRTVLGLRYYADLSVAETAAAMGLSEDAVKAHTRRAVAALRGHLLPQGAAVMEADDE